MTSHAVRLAWLAQHGWLPDGLEGRYVGSLGECIWVDGFKGQMPRSMWLRLHDGSAYLHGVTDVMTWLQCQAWIDPPPEVLVVAPVVARGLFDDLD